MRMPARIESRAWFAALLLVLSADCTPAPHDITPSSYPTAGLYTPGSTLGASDPTDTPKPGAGLGNRCVVPSSHVVDAGPGTGTLHLDYTTQTEHGRYAPKNCTAAWIETTDGQYVATIEIDAALRRPALVYWQDHTCIEKPGPDVVTSATLPDHTKAHAAMWSGLDFAGDPMPDGPYKLFIEVTESDKEPGDIGVFDFAKGPPSTVSPPVAAEGPLMQVTLTWGAMTGGKPGGAAGAH
jgi:hypothetical protein